MKSVSASIVVLAGVICLLGGGVIRGDTGGIANLFGYVVTVAGLLGWAYALRTPRDGDR